MPRAIISARNNAKLTESPGGSISEDFSDTDGSEKENTRGQSSTQKRKSTTMSTSDTSGSATKRRRVVETQPSQRRRLGEKQIDKRFYDPDQDPHERRRIRREMRDLHSKLNDSRAEYLQENSTGLIDTIHQADTLFANVKQTSDAARDSLLLVNAADIALKKVNKALLGDASVGVDVDDFVSKCISFMKRPSQADGGDRAPVSTQTQRRRRQQQVDEEEEDSGDPLNWEHLGRNACLLYNSRPCLSGFLLGPLSVQKKVRQQTQRRAREEREEPVVRSRTLHLTEEELDNQEKQSLTTICGEICEILRRAQDDNMEALNDYYNGLPDEKRADISEEDMSDLMYQHGICDDGGVPLFKFCINPRSFGQTIENLFYVSFLIKEGKAGLGYDRRALPSLSLAGDRSVLARQETERKQAVFTISFETWENIVEHYGITKSIIPHREDQVYEDGVLQDASRNDEPTEDPDIYD